MNNKLTKQDILDMIAKSSQKSEERSKKFNEDLDKSSKKFDEDLAKSRKEWEERSKKYDEDLAKSRQERKERDKEWDKKMKELRTNIDGIGKSNGEVAEDFFYNGLERNMKVGEITFHYIDKNVARKIKKLKLEGEFDIVLTNSNTILITEVKYKANPDDVDELLNKKIPNFKKLFPIYKDFNIYGAIAGLSIPKNTKRKAIEYGFFVLTQSGDNIILLNDKVKRY